MDLTLATGMPERELREHSTAWLEELAWTIQRRRARDQADLLALSALAAATPHSEDAANQLQQVLSELQTASQPAEESDLDYWADPNAKPDLAALGGLGQAGIGFQRAPAEVSHDD